MSRLMDRNRQEEEEYDPIPYINLLEEVSKEKGLRSRRKVVEINGLKKGRRFH